MTKFIIVERDLQLRDCAVFTGQIQIVDSRMVIPEVGPLQVMDGVSSPDIEHAFLFNTAWDAWRFAKRFEPHFDRERGRFCGWRRWVVRKDHDFFPGECRHNVDAHDPTNDSKGLVLQEAVIAATQAGYERGHQAALLERGLA